MRRWLVVHLPAFRLERCGFGADEIAGLIAEEKSAMRVVACTPAAVAEGIHRGTTAAEARALVPEIALLPLEPDAEARDRHALIRAFHRLSDRVATLGDDDLALDVTATAHLFGGEAGALRAALDLADRLGHVARAVIADDPVGAAALAREGSATVPRGGLASALAPLPLAALRPAPEVLDGLRAVGIRRIGELAGLDPASVAGRWGAEAVRLVRLARGEGLGLPGAPVAEDQPIEISVPLAGAATLAEIAFALPSALGRLVQELAARDLAVVQLGITLRLERERALGFPVRTGRPTRDPALLARLVQSRLDPVRLPAPVSELVLAVAESAPALGWQPGLVDRTEATEPLPELLARLTDALGEDALFSPQLVDRWRPEASWSPRAFPPPPAPLVSTGPAWVLADDPVEAQTQWVRRPTPCPRPLLLLPVPERLDVRGEEGGLPRAVRQGDDWLSVSRASDPERLTGEWWLPEPLDREYRVLAIGGASAWVYRQDRCWYLHGWFD